MNDCRKLREGPLIHWAISVVLVATYKAGVTEIEISAKPPIPENRIGEADGEVP